MSYSPDGMPEGARQPNNRARSGPSRSRDVRPDPLLRTRSSGESALPGSTLAKMQRRIEGTFYLFLVPLFLLAGRLVYLQAMTPSGASALGLAQENHPVKEVLPARRGEILASDGTAMAVTVDQYDVCANPRAVTDKPKMARLIASAIGGDPAQYQAMLEKTARGDGKKNFWVRLVRNVDADRVQKLRDLMKPANAKNESRRTRAMRAKFWEPVSLPPSPRRQYPLGDFASQLIGFTSRDGKGVDGMERSWDKELGGTPGEVVSQVDARGRPLPGFVQQWRQPVPGHTLVTTIDPQIQADTDRVINGLVKKFKPNFATAIVMRPSTGEIVAMTSAPTFNLNDRPANMAELATNRCTQFAYEPGSTWKMITACASIERIPDWSSRSVYVTGEEMVGKHRIHDWTWWVGKRNSGDKTLSEGIRDSSNICMYHFARWAGGAPVMMDYARRFGIGQVTGVGLAESPGLLPRNDTGSWSQEQLANFSFGQGMLVTPLQLIRIAATVANDGVMMKPLLVKEVRDEAGRVLQQFNPQEDHRVIQPETAREVTAMMERVTSEGTASKYVFVPGYRTAGKTGSAQKAIGKYGYAAGKFISSFVGFLPSRKPEFVILVVADEPHGSHWGSEVCGPAFGEIANRAMLHLRWRQGTSAPAPDAALMQRPKPLAQKS